MKKTFKTVCALLLALAMMVSLAACGEKSEEEVKPAEPEHTEFVYSTTYKAITGSENYMNPQVFTDDGFYVISSEKVGTEVPEGATIEYEGQYDVYASRLYFVSNDGSCRKLSGYEPLPGAENTENYINFYSGTGVAGMGVMDDGKLIVMENSYVSYFDGPESQLDKDDNWQYWKYTNDYYIRTLDADGRELSCAKVDFDTEDSSLGVYTMKLDPDGNALCTSEQKVVAVAQDGSIAYTITCDEYIDSFVELKDGRIGVTQWGEKGVELRLLDTETHKLASERYIMPDNAYNPVTGGGDYDLLYISGQTLYGYKLETEEKEKLLNWLDVDINGNYISGINVREDGSITGVLNSYEGDKVTSELVTLSQVPYDSVPHKEELTMALMDINYNYQLSNAVIKFNRSNESARIRVLDYSEYNTEDDYGAGLTKLTTEILSGNMPDLLCLSGLPYSQLASKGLLEDLYPYLDADKELSRDDIFPTVLHAMEVDGKLYEVTSTFAIESLIGASSVVGDTPGWTYAEFDAALDSMPAGCDPLDQYTTRNEMLRNLVSLEMGSLVDWNTGKVRFDSQDFIDILHFSARFPEEFDWDKYEWTDADQVENRIKEGRQMLMSASIYNIDNILYNDMYFGGETTYIGYPTNSGVGSTIRLGAGDGTLYAMSASCRDKDAGWQFLRSFLTEKGQQDNWGLPTNIKVFNKLLKEAMTPTYRKDADGNYVLDANGEKIQVSKGSYGMADGSIHNIYAVTQEQADKLLEVINTATKVYSEGDDSIYDIVNELAQAFFAGQKSAEEVARLVQSKVNIYVNEQR